MSHLIKISFVYNCGGQPYQALHILKVAKLKAMTIQHGNCYQIAYIIHIFSIILMQKASTVKRDGQCEEHHSKQVQIFGCIHSVIEIVDFIPITYIEIQLNNTFLQFKGKMSIRRKRRDKKCRVPSLCKERKSISPNRKVIKGCNLVFKKSYLNTLKCIQIMYVLQQKQLMSSSRFINGQEKIWVDPHESSGLHKILAHWKQL